MTTIGDDMSSERESAVEMYREKAMEAGFGWFFSLGGSDDPNRITDIILKPGRLTIAEMKAYDFRVGEVKKHASLICLMPSVFLLFQDLIECGMYETLPKEIRLAIEGMIESAGPIDGLIPQESIDRLQVS